MNTFLGFIAFVVIALVGFFVLLGVLHLVTKPVEDETSDLIRCAYDSLFWLQSHLQDTEGKNHKLAAKKLSAALDILIEIEQMVQEPEEDEATKELRRKYDELVAGIEDAKMFDGRGKGIDVYICDDCGAKFYTQYVDKGVTPFVIVCQSCKHGNAVHRETITLHEWVKLEAMGEKLHSWVRPTFEQFLKLPPATQDHILQGGLILREEITDEPADSQ